MIGVGSVLISLFLVLVCYSLTLTAKRADENLLMICEQNQKIEEQTQLSKDLSNKLSTLITVTQQNKPVVNINGGSLVEQISQHAAKEEKRHGVDLLSYGQK